MVKSKKKEKLKGDYTKLDSAWSDYSKEITQRIKDMAKQRAEEYEELYSLWGEYANKMTKEISEASMKDGVNLSDMQKVLNDYQEKMGERFIGIMGNENGPYKDLYELWTEYSKKMGFHISELINEGLKEQKELYEIWMDSFGKQDKEHMEGFSERMKDINEFTKSLWEKSGYMFIPPPGEGINLQQYKDLSEMWTKTYSKMMADILKSPEFARMNGDILNLNLDTIKSKDMLTTQYLEAMGLPTKKNLDDIYLKLHELDRKISDISRSIKKKNKS